MPVCYNLVFTVISLLTLLILPLCTVFMISQMEKVFEELSKNLEDVFAVGYFGLVISLAEGCRRLQVKEDEFVMVSISLEVMIIIIMIAFKGAT